MLFASIALMGCGVSNDPIAPAVRPLVERARNAPVPQQWSFDYRPDSASPYVACLNGVDEVSAIVDLESRAVFVQPNRAAPAVIITDTSLLIADNSDSETQWDEVSIDATPDSAILQSIFGEVLTDSITTGTRIPDPNMTALAALGLATAVELAAPPPGITGDTFQITIDSNKYLQELEANDIELAADEVDRTPTFTITVDEQGRVIALAVAVSPSDAPVEESHNSRYVMTVAYDIARIDLPPERARRPTELESITYPRPNESCEFGS